MSDELPKGWKEIDLDKIVIYGKGKKPKKLSAKNGTGMVPYVNIKAFEQGIIDEYADVHSSKLIEENDILVVWDGARFGLTGMGMKGAAGSTLMVITPVINYPKYIYNFINRHYSYINSKPKGTGTPHVNPDIFWKLQIPIAPLDEQKRIVAKFDQIMPKIDGVKERLERIPQIIKRFRQSVITAAVTGKLTEKWREEHPGVESAEVLLEKIKVNKTKKKEDKLRNLPYELPENWLISGFYDIAEIKTNLVNPKDYPKHPHIAPDNIEKETGKLLPYTTIMEDKVTSPKHLFFKGQIIYSKIRPYLSKAIIAEFNGLCSADMYPIESKIDSTYLFYYIMSNTFLDFASNSGTRSVLPKINQREMGRIPFPLPPTEEQKEIVRQVCKLFTFADKLENHYKKAKEKIAKFPQSILAKAFRGELVPQWPDLPAPQSGKYWVYVVKCENDTNYIGQTSNLRNRWSEHLEGEGSDWTKRYSPHYVMYWERCDSREHALKREKELKSGFGRKWIKREETAGRLWRAGEPAEKLLERIKEEKAKMACLRATHRQKAGVKKEKKKFGISKRKAKRN